MWVQSGTMAGILSMKTMTCALAVVGVSVCATAADLDTNLIQKVTGLTGKMNAEEAVFKVSAPRTDVKVSVDKWQMPPFMGLTSWAAFKPGMIGRCDGDGRSCSISGRSECRDERSA